MENRRIDLSPEFELLLERIAFALENIDTGISNIENMLDTQQYALNLPSPETKEDKPK